MRYLSILSELHLLWLVADPKYLYDLSILSELHQVFGRRKGEVGTLLLLSILSELHLRYTELPKLLREDPFNSF